MTAPSVQPSPNATRSSLARSGGLAGPLALTALTTMLVGLAACGPMAEPILPTREAAPASADATEAVLATEAPIESGQGKLAVADDGAVLVDLDLGEFAIASPILTFTTGTTYRFVIANTGVLSHELRILPRGTSEEMLAMGGDMHSAMGDHAHGGEVLLAGGGELLGGTTVTRDFVFARPGAYELACHIAGHLEGGMLLPIDVVGEAQPLTEADIVVDTESMPGMACHAMGTTIMGDCSEEDIARLKEEILGGEGAGGMMDMHDDAADMHDDAAADDHADPAMGPGMMGDDSADDGAAEGDG